MADHATIVAAYKMGILIQTPHRVIQNILYYKHSNDALGEFVEGNLSGIFARITAPGDILYSMASCISDDCAIIGAYVDAVNQHNEVISDNRYEESLAVPIVGSIGTFSADSDAACAIVAFKAIRLNSQPTSVRVPKRTHIKVGPITTDSIERDGALVAGGVVSRLNTLAARLALTISTGATSYFYPVRIGQANKDDLGAAGQVNQVIVRPYATTFAGRRFDPQGN